MNDPQNREEAIFEAALALPAAQRAAHVAEACGGDTQLRDRVMALLTANERSAGFLEAEGAPGPRKTVVLSLTPTEKAGDSIGRYKLLQQIGEGGCGVVYMAEQEEPVRRRVALKVIKLGMDTKSVIARFEAERQALAMMDHPNIAKVLDAGATENGRPFFVMELVRGIKITEYCDQNKLSTDERLKIFVQICHAIQHAHQKGIIHRDIKPSNILVTLHDGLPVPKVIDFGIAKATQGRLTDQTLFTAFEQFIGTPAYMSPEQAEMSGLDIDTRSDIYSLGVLLYELLTGKTPFDAKELLASGLDAMRHTIREQEPARPSTRLSTMLNADLTTTASCRRTDAPKLIHLLSGDIDWIVMKALEKDRTRRFESASSMAMDIQRYLNNDPVEARPPSTLYRFQKLVRRNKLAFAAAAAVMAALTLGFVVSTVLFVRERQARQRADEAERIQRTLAKDAEAGRRMEAERRVHAQLGEQIGLSALYMTEGRFEEAESQIAPVPLSVLTNYIATASIFNALGKVHARRGEWAAARTNFDKVLAIVPADYPGYYRQATLLVETGDQSAYGLLYPKILGQFQATTDAVAAVTMAKSCLLLPLPPADRAALDKLVDIALTTGTNNPSWPEVLYAKGLAEYREEHWATALEWMKKAVAWDGDRYHNMASRFGLAMAEYQNGQLEQAQSNLAEATDYFTRKAGKLGTDGLGDEWPDYIVAHQIMLEAQAVIEDPVKTAAAKLAEAQAAQDLVLREHALREARKSQWREAMADFATLDATDTGIQGMWYERAVALLAGGDEAGYRAHRKSMLARFGSITDPRIARRLAKACLLLPASADELAVAGQLAETALPQESDWRETTKALAEYRQGHFADAAAWAKQSLARPALDRRDAQMWPVLAMAQFQLNQTGDARVSLSKGAEIFDAKLPKLDSGDLGESWVDVIIAHVLLTEAKTLMDAGAAAK